MRGHLQGPKLTMLLHCESHDLHGLQAPAALALLAQSRSHIAWTFGVTADILHIQSVPTPVLHQRRPTRLLRCPGHPQTLRQQLWKLQRGL